MLGPEATFENLFRDLDTKKVIKIGANGDWGNLPRKLEIILRSRQQSSTVRASSTEGSDTERLTQPEFEGESEIIFRYSHSNNKDYTSRGWWIKEQLNSTDRGPVVTGEGIRQERDIVPNKPNAVFMAAVHRENLQATASRFGKIQLAGEDEQVLNFLRPLEPRLERLTSITVKDTPIVYAYIKGANRPIPIQLLGEGLNRMLSLVLCLNQVREGGMLLIDEIENGLHYSVHEEVFSAMIDLANEFDVQIFAATHSGEYIRAAYRVCKEREQAKHGLRYYRLDRVKDEVAAVGFDMEMLETAIKHEMVVR